VLPRKSDFESFNYCRYQYKLIIIEGHEPDFIPSVMSTGTDFHTAHKEFYEKIDFAELNKLQEYFSIWRYFRSLMPPNDPILTKLCDNFATIETQRWELCRKEMGIKAEHYFKPVALECYIQSMRIRRRGHFDRIDRMFDDEFAVGDIKTGNHPGSYISSLRRELVWYLEILEQDDAMWSKEWKPRKLMPIQSLIPKPPKYIFAYYPKINWVLFEKPHKATRTALTKKEQIFWECLQMDDFKRNLGPHCAWCFVGPECMRRLKIKET